MIIRTIFIFSHCTHIDTYKLTLFIYLMGLPYEIFYAILITKLICMLNKWLYYILLLDYPLLLTMVLHLHCGRCWPIVLFLTCSYLNERKDSIT